MPPNTSSFQKTRVVDKKRTHFYGQNDVNEPNFCVQQMLNRKRDYLHMIISIVVGGITEWSTKTSKQYLLRGQLFFVC
jgi:hypothetical protein